MYPKAFCIAFLICILSQVILAKNIESCLTFQDLKSSVYFFEPFETRNQLEVYIGDLDIADNQLVKQRGNEYMLVDDCNSNSSPMQVWTDSEKLDSIREETIKINFDECILFKDIRFKILSALEKKYGHKSEGIKLRRKIENMADNEGLFRFSGGEYALVEECGHNMKLWKFILDEDVEEKIREIANDLKEKITANTIDM